MIYNSPITIYVILLVFKGICGINGVNRIESISAEALAVNGTISLRIRWNATLFKGTNLDIDINTKTDKYCPVTMCDEYGQPLSNVTEIILPRGHIPLTEHDECNLRPGCTYEIILKTSNHKSSKSIIYTIPNCVGSICACKHRLLLPKPRIFAEMLPNDSIRVNWNISLVNISHIGNNDVALKQLYIRVNQHTKASLPWHGLGYIVETLHPLFNRLDSAQNNEIIKGTKIVKINSTILSKTQKFNIFAHILDNFNCRGPDEQFLIDCIESKCSCKHDILLPQVQLFAKVLPNSSIEINWSISLVNKSLINILDDGVILQNIYIRIDRHLYPSLAWETIGTYYSSLQIHKIEENQIIKGNKVIGMTSTILPETKFQIFGYLVDNFNCQGAAGKFFLIVPPNTADMHQTITSFYSVFISIVVPMVLLVLLAMCVFHYIYKTYRKSASSPNWISIYRNTTPLENIQPIPMEENRLYKDKEYLEKLKADVFEISHSKITFEHEIGRGAFGKVYKAIAQQIYSSPGPTVVAVKKLKRSLDSGAKEEFLGEIQTMKNVGKHQNVVQLLGYCTIKEPFVMVMEYIKYGNLIDYLHTVRHKHLDTALQQLNKNAYLSERPDSATTNSLQRAQLKYLEIKHSASSVSEDSYIMQPDATLIPLRPSITETTYTVLTQETNRLSADSVAFLDYVLDNKELHNFAIQIGKGMRHLEEKGITHRDLAARNVLIDEGKVLKISDFGLSRQGIYVNTKCKQVPLRWLSLEAIKDQLYSSKSDVWAFGVVLWEIGTLGAFPYPTLNNQELLHFLDSGRRLEKPEICTNFLYELMLNCWNEYPEKRPSFREIVNKLQPHNQKIYVEFSTLGSDYVFPPTREEVLENKNKPDNMEMIM